MTAPRVGRFVDVEKLVVTWLAGQLGDGRRVVTQPPDTITSELVWVASVGGPADYDTTTLRVDVQCFKPGKAGASWPLAGDVHTAMGVLDGQTVIAQPVDSVRCPAYPVRQFWSSDIDRTRATYELDLPVL